MTLGEMVAAVREKHYPAARNAAASYILNLGGQNSDASAKDILHRQGNYNLTKRIADIGVPPELAANLTDFAYLGNEALTGTLGAMIGKPFFSDYGFRWKDVAINREGQDKAIAELRAKAALRAALMNETMSASPAVPFGGKE